MNRKTLNATVAMKRAHSADDIDQTGGQRMRTQKRRYTVDHYASSHPLRLDDGEEECEKIQCNEEQKIKLLELCSNFREANDACRWNIMKLIEEARSKYTIPGSTPPATNTNLSESSQSVRGYCFSARAGGHALEIETNSEPPISGVISTLLAVRMQEAVRQESSHSDTLCGAIIPEEMGDDVLLPLIRRWTETSASTLHGELTPSDDGSCSGSSDPDRATKACTEFGSKCHIQTYPKDSMSIGAQRVPISTWRDSRSSTLGEEIRSPNESNPHGPPRMPWREGTGGAINREMSLRDRLIFDQVEPIEQGSVSVEMTRDRNIFQRDGAMAEPLQPAMHEGRCLESVLQPESVQVTWEKPRTDDSTDQNSWQPTRNGENNQRMDNGEPLFCDHRSLSPMHLLPEPPTEPSSDRGLPNPRDDSPSSRTQRDSEPKPKVIPIALMNITLLDWDIETAKYDALNNVITTRARLEASKWPRL